MPGGINMSALGKDDAEDVLWCVVESIADTNDTASSIISVVHFLRELYGVDDVDDTVVPNPAFLSNGHSGRSPQTRTFLKSDAFVSLGGSAVSLAGGLASGATLVDVGSIARDGSAVGSTVAHMVQIEAAAKRFRNSKTIVRWMEAILKAKSAKLAMRGVSLVGASVPVPGLSLGVSIGTTAAKLGIKVTLSKLVARTAMEVHWRAYQETVIARQGEGKPVGPASAMFYEIFTRYGFMRIFGKSDIASFIREPGGWMALNYKLMQM